VATRPRSRKVKPTHYIIVVVAGVCDGRRIYKKPTQILQPRLNLSRS